MSEETIRQDAAGGRRRRAGVEAVLVAATAALAALLGLVGLAITGPEKLISLIVLIVLASLFNLLLWWLGRRGVSQAPILAGAAIGNLLFLTLGIYLTGGFRSPLLPFYALYVVIAGFRYGWWGTLVSFGLCVLSWAGLAVLAPPTNLEGWAWVAMTATGFVMIALVVGSLAQRYVEFNRASLQRSRELTFLREAGRSLSASLDPQKVLAGTLARVNEVLDVEAASLALLDPETGWITIELAIGGGNEAVQGLRLELGQGIVGQVIEEGRPELVPDVSADPRWYKGVDQVSGWQTRSILCVPLRVKGQVIGALEALNKRDGPFTEEDLRLLSSLADLAAQSIENARLHDQIQQHMERLQYAYDELQRLDELKSTFIRNVSHELRTPLALIEGYVELILEEQMGPLRPEQRQGLTTVMDKTTLLTSMVNDFISLQTIGAMYFDLEILRPETIVQEAVERIRPKAEKARIELEMCLPETGPLPSVRGDARRLGQVFHHLLDNAVKFSPNGGRVCVTLGQEGDMVLVSVQDEGIGVQTGELERIFDRFYQVDGSSTRRYGGTGTGLALAKEVVEAHGGAVFAESEPGKGSRFSVFLPALDEQGGG